MDSGAYGLSVMRRRCADHIDIMNDFRDYLRTNSNLHIRPFVFTEQSHPFVDGNSNRQRNGYDCGVFALKNVEEYILDRPFQLTVTQAAMKLLRCNIIFNMLRFAEDTGIIIVAR